MYTLITGSLIVGYIIMLFVSIITINYILHHRKDYGSQLLAILNILAFIFSGIMYSTFIVFSLIFYPSEFLWKLSIVCGFLTLGISALINSFLKEYKKIPILPFVIYTSLFGFLIGSLFSPDSIILINNTSNKRQFLITDISRINYSFNTVTGIIVALFQIILIIYFLYISIVVNISARNKQLTKGLFINTLFFGIHVLMYILYIYFQLTIFRELHITLLWVNLIGVSIMIIKKPEMFLVLTNKIYYLNIYHKSGILLYSYKFELEETLTDSSIWGNILIGINHILSEFIDKKDQIDVMRTKMTDIIVNYNNELGFAVLVITNKKNEILENLMEKFMIDFESRYETELNMIQDLNKIINVSEFADVKELVEKSFAIYL
jgi:hypothetical protein